MAESYQTVLTGKEGSIGIVTLNRPEHLNTFTAQLSQDLNSALREMEQDPEVRVVIVKGAGKAFCAGIDVSELEGLTPLELYQFITQMEQMSLTIASMAKPVIAAVHNIAVANGIGLVASADLAVASQDAKFGATAVKVGLFCMGPAIPLSRSLGRKKALELLLTGDLIDAVEAERIGLINKVVPREDLEKEAMAMAQKIAAYSPLGVQLGKSAFYRSADLEYSKAFELSNNHFAILCTTEDAGEGVAAFLEGREPVWKRK